MAAKMALAGGGPNVFWGSPLATEEDGVCTNLAGAGCGGQKAEAAGGAPPVCQPFFFFFRCRLSSAHHVSWSCHLQHLNTSLLHQLTNHAEGALRCWRGVWCALVYFCIFGGDELNDLVAEKFFNLALNVH